MGNLFLNKVSIPATSWSVSSISMFSMHNGQRLPSGHRFAHPGSSGSNKLGKSFTSSCKDSALLKYKN